MCLGDYALVVALDVPSALYTEIQLRKREKKQTKGERESLGASVGKIVQVYLRLSCRHISRKPLGTSIP